MNDSKQELRQLIYNVRNNSIDPFRYLSYFARKNDVRQRKLIKLSVRRMRLENLKKFDHSKSNPSLPSMMRMVRNLFLENLPFLYRVIIILNFCVGLFPLIYLFYTRLLPFRPYSFLLLLPNINWVFIVLVIFLFLIKHLNAHFKYVQIQNNARETLISCLFNDVSEHLDKHNLTLKEPDVLGKTYTIRGFFDHNERLIHPTVLENYELRLLGDEDGYRMDGLIEDGRKDPSLLFARLYDRYDLFPRQEFLTSKKDDFDDIVRKLNPNTLMIVHEYLLTRDWLFKYNVILRLPAVFVLGLLIGMMGPFSIMMIPLGFGILSYPILGLIEHILSRQDYLDLKDAIGLAMVKGSKDLDDLIRRLDNVDKMNHYEPYLLPGSQDRVLDDSGLLVLHLYLKYKWNNDRFWEPLTTGLRQNKNNLVRREILAFVGFFLLGIPMGSMLVF